MNLPSSPATLPVHAERLRELARLPVLPAGRRIDRLLEDLLGVLLGDLLDVHAAFGRRHHRDAAGGAVEQHAEVVLVIDREALLDEQALDLLALGAGLRA